MKMPAVTKMPPVTEHILAIEASANQLSIAVMINGEVVAGRRHLSVYSHATRVVSLSIETIADAGTTFDAMTHVAVGCGPGSFTGIRVALAEAKGFCMAYQATGVGVSGLQALAHAATHVAPDIRRLVWYWLTRVAGRSMPKYLTIPLSPWGRFLRHLFNNCRI